MCLFVTCCQGKQAEIERDDWRLKAAPPGHDSIVARGRTEPQPGGDVELEFDGHEVVAPTGRPMPQPKWSGSNFSQSEYLIYKESQARLRYVLICKFH